MSAGSSDHADIVGRPPAVGLAFLAIGAVLHLAFPVEIAPGVATWAAGIPLAVLALALFGLATREFREHGTPVRGNEPVTTIVESGPYRFTRNPIYVSFLLLQLGIALTANSAWILASLAPMFLYLSTAVVPREESYLAGKFGEDYLRYKQTVRRWI